MQTISASLIQPLLRTLMRALTYIIATGLLIAPSLQAAPHKKAPSKPIYDFNQQPAVVQFIQSMSERYGFETASLQSLFAQAHHDETSLQLIKPAPQEKPKNWKAYRARFVEGRRIQAGVEFWNQYEDILNRAEKVYGVPAEIVVGILGVETMYGRITGKFRIFDVLSTLAFDYPDVPNRTARMDFFRSELEQFLLLTRDTHSAPFDWKGSYAGAIGWPQFMPSNIRRYAVDFDGDGKIDLIGSPADIIGSVAHFLAEAGWQRSPALIYPATLLVPNDTPGLRAILSAQKLQATLHLQDLKDYVSSASIASENSEQPVGLIELPNGDDPAEYWLAAPNFFVITQYNRSYFYAMSVIDLGKVIQSARLASPAEH